MMRHFPLLLLLLAGCAPQIVIQPFPFPLPLGCEGRFDVVNQSQQVVRRFEAGPRGTDLLGRATLPPGTFLAVTAGPGRTDLRAVLDDGRVLALDGVDACSLDAVLVTSAGLRPR